MYPALEKMASSLASHTCTGLQVAAERRQEVRKTERPEVCRNDKDYLLNIELLKPLEPR